MKYKESVQRVWTTPGVPELFMHPFFIPSVTRCGGLFSSPFGRRRKQGGKLAQSPIAHKQSGLGAQQPGVRRLGPLSHGVHGSQGAESGSVQECLGGKGGMVEVEWWVCGLMMTPGLPGEQGRRLCCVCSGSMGGVLTSTAG